MEMPKPTDADKDAFRSLVPDDPAVEVKPMFGNLGAFVNGNMFMGLFGSQVGVKLEAADRDELLAVEGAGPFGPAERPMGGYVAMPDRWRSSPDEAAPWIDRGVDLRGVAAPEDAQGQEGPEEGLGQPQAPVRPAAVSSSGKKVELATVCTDSSVERKRRSPRRPSCPP